MSTHNHTAITTGAAANASTINTPLGTLDAAIGDLDALTTTAKTSAVAAINEVAALIGAAASASGSIGTSIDTDGTLKADSVDVAAVIKDAIITDAKLVADIKIGSLASLQTENKTSVVAAINNVFGGLKSGTIYETRGGASWNGTTKILSLAGGTYIIHGKSGNRAIFSGAPSINFSAITTYGFAYITGIDRNAIQTPLATAIVVEEFNALSRNLTDDDVFVLATYSANTKEIFSPYLYNSMRVPKTGIYESRGTVTWDSTTKVLTLPVAYIMHERAGKYFRFAAQVTVDFSAIISYGYAYIKGVDPNAVQLTYTTADIVVEEFSALTRNLFDTDVYIIATYATNTGAVWTPFLEAIAQLDYLTRAAQDDLGTWTNLYPHLYSKLPNICGKLLNPSADVKIVLWGDSLLARTEHTSAGGLNPAALPPLLLTQNLAWYIWDNLNLRQATYKRYDAAGSYFTEVGLWVTSTSGDNTASGGPDTNWDDEGDRLAYTRISDAATATFAWTLGTSDDESGCNLIYRTDTNGDAAATITVAQGNGYLEYWNGSSWAEANAATFAMLEADEGARRGNTVYNKRLKLRKATSHQSDSVTITIGKATADGDRLLYWGVELYDEIHGYYIPQLVNSARGGHTLAMLYDYMDDDVLDQNPDVVILELPLLNEIVAGGATKTSILNAVQDTVWGDRGGATNTWSLKAISNDWADFEVLVIIPHHTQSHYAADSSYTELIASVDCREIYNAVKALIISKNDVAMIDMAAAFEREIDADALFTGDYYAAMNASSITGTSYTVDDTHQNNKGTKLYARHICPIFDFNTL